MISVNIIADSIHHSNRVTTFELEYPRYIHSELMTHRVFSRNAASSRAIPVEKLIELVQEQSVLPIWTYNQKGMQGKRVTNGKHIQKLNEIWLAGADSAIRTAQSLVEAGAHKQNANRVLEPFQHIKVVLTGSNFTNWFELRNHPDAQPEIQALAKEMLSAMAMSTPRKLKDTDWHMPYVSWVFLADGTQQFLKADGTNMSLSDAKKVSASCCAQVSYRLTDDTLDKAKVVYARLVTSKPLHASPFEHQVRPANFKHVNRGNLTGWYQLRQEIEDGV